MINKTDLLGSGRDAEPTHFSETPEFKANEKTRLSGVGRKRYKYLIKQGLPPVEVRQKAVEPIKKSSSDKGLKTVRCEKKSVNPKNELRGQTRVGIPLCFLTKATQAQRLQAYFSSNA